MHVPSELLPMLRGTFSTKSVYNLQGQLQLIPVYSMDFDGAHFVFRGKSQGRKEQS